MRIKRSATRTIRVLANPIAYRVLAVVGMRGQQTTSELAEVLADVPTSSLYRQLSRLRDAGVLRVVGERQARGAVERTYALAWRDAGAITASEAAKIPVASLRATFRNFLATMVADISTFVESRAFSRTRSQVNAFQAICKLTDGEYADVARNVNAEIARAKAESVGGPTAKRRYFYLVMLPELGTK